jgi:LuxR family quorum-sensing system transcriptional regulator CciR
MTMIHALQRLANAISPGPLPASAGLAALVSALAMPFADSCDIPSLADSFGDAANALGFPLYVITRISRPHSSARSRTNLEMIGARYPDDWVQHYQQRGYASIDPVHRTAFTRSAPYRWHDITGLNTLERRLLDEARDAGLISGLSIPIHEPGGSILLLSLSGPLPCVDSVINLRLAYMISTQLHFELQRLSRIQSRGPARYLSPRQRECLVWVARGKSSWAIGRILGISHHTVDYHIAEAMKILDVNSRTAAAINAMVQGLIQP